MHAPESMVMFTEKELSSQRSRALSTDETFIIRVIRGGGADEGGIGAGVRTLHWVVAARMGVGTGSMGVGNQPGIASFSDACLNYLWQ